MNSCMLMQVERSVVLAHHSQVAKRMPVMSPMHQHSHFGGVAPEAAGGASMVTADGDKPPWQQQ